jgi:S-adenosylmethionine-diacylglycerol 3-amino-3-carboxypropyl transferase
VNLSSWLGSRVFNLVHGHQLVYNTCWEDPRVDRAALQLNADDVLMMITSAGCNALDYALQAPQKIIAVDLNSRQNALLELKIAGIKLLDFERFFAIFGRGRINNFPQIYEQQLRTAISPTARRYWDRHLNFFQGTEYRPSFYFRGTTGYFAWMINRYIDCLAGAREAIDALLAAESIDEQRRIYDGYSLHEAVWRPYIRWFLRRDSTLSLLGVPRPQRDQLDEQYAGGIARFIEDMTRYVFTCLPLHDNYFWRVYLTGSYTEACCPEYLRRENFDRLKAGLVDRIEIHTASVGDYLSRAQQPITRFVLLDHMDWLSSLRSPWLQQEWQAIVRSAAPCARVLWRSAGYVSDFVDRLEVDLRGQRCRVGELLQYRTQMAAELHALDRVHTYGGFFIADLAV